MIMTLKFPHELYFLNREDFDKAVETVMTCEHNHWFGVKQEPLTVLCNDAGLACIARSGVYYIPNTRE